MWLGNGEWAIYVGGKYRMDNICGWEMESGQYMWVRNIEWAIYVGAKYRVDNICG